MKIALDYDLTYSLDPVFWNAFIDLCKSMGHEIRIVTIRDDRFDRTEPVRIAEKFAPVIYTRGVAKQWYLTHFGEGFFPDVWIDDNPKTILDNSEVSQSFLENWRQMREEAP